MEKSYNIERFIKFFWFCIASLIVFLILSFVASETGEGHWYLFAGIAGFATTFFHYSMLWSLCDDILDRKGYAPGEIPLILIVIAFSYFAFLYLLLLPLKNSVTMPSTIQTKENHSNISDKKSGERTETICKNCGYTNYAYDNDKNIICKKCGKSIFLGDVAVSEWKCPKCGKSNPNSSRMCKDCGYQK